MQCKCMDMYGRCQWYGHVWMVWTCMDGCRTGLTFIHCCRSTSGSCHPNADESGESLVVSAEGINPHSFSTVSSTMTLLPDDDLTTRSPVLVPSGVSMIGICVTSVLASSTRRSSGTRNSMDPEGKLLLRMDWIPPQAASGRVVKMNLKCGKCEMGYITRIRSGGEDEPEVWKV